MDQAGDVNYNSFQSTTLFNVIDNSKQDQTITFDVLATKIFGDTNFDLKAKSSSVLTISYASSDATIATVSGSTVTIVGAGSTIITASQAGDATFNPASDVQHSLVIDKADQTISIEAIADKLITDGGFNVTGSTTSGLTLSYAIQSGPATISGTTISLNGTSGAVIVEVTQAGNSNYNITSEITSFQVNDPSLQDQTITFDPLAPVTYGDPNFLLSATGGASENTITYTSSNPNIATVNGNMVTIVGVGTTSITASQSGNENYNAANSIEKNLAVSKADQAIVFSTIAPATYGDANFLLTATGGASGNEITFSSSNPEVATITGNTVNIIGAGTTPFTASQAGDANYNGASDVKQSLTVNKATQTITFTALDALTFGDTGLDLTATASSGLPVNFSVVSGSISISGSTVSISGAGVATIAVNQVGNDTFNAAEEVTRTLIINKATQTITIQPIENQLASTAPFVIAATIDSGQPLVYEVSGPATISGVTLTLTGVAGSLVLTVSQVGSDNYLAANAPEEFDVIETITGVETLQTTIEFYPNPAKEFLKIVDQNLSKVIIYDLSGQVVLVDQILGNSHIDLGRIKAGHYLLVVNRKDGFSLSKKFIKTN
ncbi:MAG: hypothetical protein ACJA2S_000524 [Cyclobacteriaceae bacterium]